MKPITEPSYLLFMIAFAYFSGFIGLVFWTLKKMHAQAMGKMDKIADANHATSLLVAQHEVKIEANEKSTLKAHERLNSLCQNSS